MRTLSQTQWPWPPEQEFNITEIAKYRGAREMGATNLPDAGTFSPVGFPGPVLKALGRGLESVAIKLALTFGYGDERQLTDLIFYARHPERQGRRLAQSEPNFDRLSREWMQVRDLLVRPSLKSTTSRTGRPITPPGKPSWVGVVTPLLNRYRGDMPLGFLLGWIAVESGGINTDAVTSKIEERGYFQIHPGESKSLQLDHQRLSRDPEYSIQGGIKLIGSYGERVKQLGFAYGTDLFWHLVKLFHWLPKGVYVTCAHMREHHFKPTTWEEFKQYMLRNRLELANRIGVNPECLRGPACRKGCLWDPYCGIGNVEKLFAQARVLGQA